MTSLLIRHSNVITVTYEYVTTSDRDKSDSNSARGFSDRQLSSYPQYDSLNFATNQYSLPNYSRTF